MRVLTLVAQGCSGEAETAGRRRYRPWPRRQWSEEMAKFVGMEASRQACVDEGVAGDQAKLQSFTAVLEVALIGDGEDGRAARV
jgi:hypothetical protein